MTFRRVLGVLLIVIGLIALAWGGITYTRHRDVVDLGPIHASADTKEHIPLPPVFGIVAVGAGVVLLVAGRKEPT